MLRKLLMGCTAVVLVAAMVGCECGKPAASGRTLMAGEATIMDRLIDSGNHTTLVKAIRAADLEDTLRQQGPFTLFAPTDDAFAKLAEGCLDDLLQPENKSKLTSILLYHVVAGRHSAKDIACRNVLYSLQGRGLPIVEMNGQISVAESKVTLADQMASNGVIHNIDTVLIP